MRSPLWVCLLLAGMVACGGGDEGEEPAAQAFDPAGAWRLAMFAGEPVAEPSRITLVLAEDGQLSGFGGCNRYFSSYETGEGGTLSISRLGATRMACDGDVMQLEQDYFAALEGARGYRGDEQTLEILDGDGNVSLSYRADPSAAS